ncbi:MAG: hypothetical protein RMM53_04770 [Bacteroidia bacterium]|nr:hypothetical protein [Bacteroidia bacterium]MDW8333511.1 hypothetical protein [Bacteroidia bacterium]
MRKNRFTLKHFFAALAILALLGMGVPHGVYHYYKSSVPRTVEYHKKRLRWNRDELEQLAAMARRACSERCALEVRNLQKSRKIEFTDAPSGAAEFLSANEREFSRLMFAADLARLRMDPASGAVHFVFDLFEDEPYELVCFPNLDMAETRTRSLIQSYRDMRFDDDWLAPLDRRWAILARSKQSLSKK